ncbi:bacillithiol biosynthesis cysteine-adding enzyme BshC [Myroides sp. LJL110]
MPTDNITFQNSGYFSKLMVDYLNQSPTLKPLYNRFATIENFEPQIQEKSQNFPSHNRQVLSKALQLQYANTSTSIQTQKNIDLLNQSNTFTITTGHQLNLFTGPLYFLYKIISVINLTIELKQKYPQNNFVPVYWMATEDHDFLEINHFYFQDKKICWPNENASGPVGRLSTQSLDQILEVFKQHLPLGDNAQQIKQLFTQTYLNHTNLGQATRFLANELFAEYGLVIIDGDDTNLKELFAPTMASELLKRQAITQVQKSFSILKQYNIQVNPREINLFYILDGLRERIVFKDDLYYINNTDLVFNEKEILQLLKTHPENFSPNVILRPLYQETILPNLCYIGGGGELAYWLELKAVFELHQITFPILLLRNSVLLVDKKQAKKLDALALSYQDIFKKQDQLILEKTKQYAKVNYDFTTQKRLLSESFQDLEQIASQTDKSFIGAVQAQKAKQIKGLANLEKRLLKAEKKNNADKLQRLILLQNELFPGGSLQERSKNFSSFYIQYGPELIKALFNKLKPLDQKFDIIVL